MKSGELQPIMRYSMMETYTSKNVFLYIRQTRFLIKKTLSNHFWFHLVHDQNVKMKDWMNEQIDILKGRSNSLQFLMKKKKKSLSEQNGNHVFAWFYWAILCSSRKSYFVFFWTETIHYNWKRHFAPLTTALQMMANFKHSSIIFLSALHKVDMFSSQNHSVQDKQ